MTNETEAQRAAIPEDLYGSWSPTAAPDARVALVSDRGGEPGVWIHRPGSAELFLLRAAPPRVLSLSWSPDGAWLACLAAAADASRTQLWVLRPDEDGAAGEPRLLAGAGTATAELGGGPRHGWSADGRLLVTETERARPARCLLIDPGTGAREAVTSGPLTLLIDVSADSRRALLRVGSRGARSLRLVELPGGDGREVDTGAGAGSAEQGCLSPDGTTVYARTDIGRARAALVGIDVGRDGTGGTMLLSHRPDDELDGFELAPDGRHAALLWNVQGGRSELSLLALDGTASEHQLSPPPRDVVDEVRFTADGSGLLLTAQDWTDPRGVWLRHLASGETRPLSSRAHGRRRHASRGATTHEVSTADMVRSQLRHLRSGDGTELSGWLYTPSGPPPWPTMIHLHGGPESQERPVYNSLFQSLVAAGVAVFAPNVRGSSGFGREFLHADDRESRYGVIADVAACVRHLVDTGVAAEGRVGVMGRSYGGWLTQAALVWHPELFAVGISVCGMSDFHTFYSGTEPAIAAAAVSEYGDPVTDAALLTDLSPLHRLDRLKAPLLVVHGERDTNVPVTESRQLVGALAARGAEHRYLEFAGEGHDLLLTANRVAFVRASVAWVTTHLTP